MLPKFQNKSHFIPAAAASSIGLLALTFALLLPPADIFVSAGSQASMDDEAGRARAVSLNYKVYVDAGKIDCYYQYVYSYDVLYVFYQVLEGREGEIGTSVKGPAGNFLMEPEYKLTNTYHNPKVLEGGYYSVCFDNQFSTFTTKLVSLYLTSYNADSWARFASELQSIGASVDNSTSSLQVVDSRIAQMLQHLFSSRGTESRDFVLLHKINYYVGLFSTIQCTIIIIAGITHVMILKSLFNETANPHTKFKVRL